MTPAGYAVLGILLGLQIGALFGLALGLACREPWAERIGGRVIPGWRRRP